MKINERTVDDVTVLDLEGKLLIGEGDELLREKINSLVEGGTTKILLNLGEVPYMDSAGLGEVVPLGPEIGWNVGPIDHQTRVPAVANYVDRFGRLQRRRRKEPLDRPNAATGRQ